MKRCITFCLALVCTSLAWAQSAEPYEASVDGVTHSGWRLPLRADREAVAKEFHAFWKENGKARKQQFDFTITEIVWDGLSATEAEAYATVSSGEPGTTWVWLSIEAAAMGPGLDSELLTQQMLDAFEFQFYRSELTALITQAEEVEAYLSKNTYRRDREIGRLERNLEGNAAELERLEEKIEANAQEKKNLEEALMAEKALRQQAQKDLEVIQERLRFLRDKLANFLSNEAP